MEKNKRIVAFVDGASSKGKAGIGVVIREGKEGRKISEIKENVGRKTNNEAEYLALIKALQKIRDICKEKKIRSCTIFMDSQLVVNQINGNYKVKAKNLLPLFKKAKELEKEIAEKGCEISIKWINREKNISDRISKLAKEG